MNAPYYYYDDLKKLARRVRAENGLTSPRITVTDMRRIYFRNNIELDVWPHKFKKLRGAFMCDELGTTVMLASNLPQDPMVFTMAHELKHFYKDRHLRISYCDQSNFAKTIELGAEVFAAELIFPDADFAAYLQRMRVGRNQCTPETLIKLKHTTRTTLSYAGLAIKAERLQFAPPNSLTIVKTWRRLEREYRGR
ncbi:MAG: ImmA/IrrE family metallo-endopeptidase [Pyrinomonadaceae bacterium]